LIGFAPANEVGEILAVADFLVAVTEEDVVFADFGFGRGRIGQDVGDEDALVGRELRQLVVQRRGDGSKKDPEIGSFLFAGRRRL